MKVRLLNRFALSSIASLVTAVVVPAQSAKMESVSHTFRCAFTQSASADFRSVPPKVALRKESFELVFDQVDYEKGTGRMIGNVGGTDIVVVSSPEVTTLLERVGSGALQITVIYRARTPDGTYKAVHSRHTVSSSGEPIPSQYYGVCRELF